MLGIAPQVKMSLYPLGVVAPVVLLRAGALVIVDVEDLAGLRVPPESDLKTFSAIFKGFSHF